MKKWIKKLIEGHNLAESEMIDAMSKIMTGQATSAQIAGFITALRIKGETVDEMTGAVKVMREKSIKVETKTPFLIDTCGTGGDGSNSFNISTTVAFVVAGTGVSVAKHGNRSVSSKSGSADLLQELGVKIELSPEQVGEKIDEIGIGFMFAPIFHSAMKHAIGPRRELGIRTIFNLIGPLTNPASAEAQLVGVYKKELTEPMAKVLQNLGTRSAMVVHGLDGLDEITTTTQSQISELSNGEIKTYKLDPTDFAIPRSSLMELVGGDAGENAKITMEILRGEKSPKRDIVLINSAAALRVAGKIDDLREGLELSKNSIDSGKALEKLEALRG